MSSGASVLTDYRRRDEIIGLDARTSEIRSPSPVTRVRWCGVLPAKWSVSTGVVGRMLQDAPAAHQVASDADLVVTATTDVIWIDERRGDPVWTVASVG